MLAGKRVHKEIILAMVTAILLVVATSRTARAEGTCTSGTCYEVDYVNYFSNSAPGNGRGYVRITDPLELNTSGASTIQPDEICAMIYVFDVREGLQECCGCPITADGLLTLSYGAVAGADLNTNPVTVTGQFFTGASGFLYDGVIRILSTLTNASTTPQTGITSQAQLGTAVYLKNGVGCDPYSGACCDPGTSHGTATLTTTVRAWADHIQSPPVVTNTEFEENPITASDAGNLASLCQDNIGNHGATFNGYCTCGNESAPYLTGGE